MKFTLIGSLLGAVAASACCIGPVVFALAGVGAFGAAAGAMEPYRPLLLGGTWLMLGVSVVAVYRPGRKSCEADGSCKPPSRRRERTMVWLVAGLVALLSAFPLYIGYLL